MDNRDGVTTSSTEQMRSFVRVRVQGEITSKSGKDQGVMTNHPWGLRLKVRISYEKTPYLDRGDDNLKMTQIKGAKSKMPRWAVERKMGPNHPRKGLGRLARSDRPRYFLWQFDPPFDLAPSGLFVAPSSDDRRIQSSYRHQSPESCHHKVRERVGWARCKDQRRRREGSKRRTPSRWPRGVPKLHRCHLHRWRSPESPSPLCASILVGGVMSPFIPRVRWIHVIWSLHEHYAFRCSMVYVYASALLTYVYTTCVLSRVCGNRGD
jgi:hypothetical protein